MEYMKKLAPRFGMECLLSEKPFEGINGSGKHNNWSLGTDTGINLLKPGKTPEENKLFLLSLAAVIKAVDEYQDLMRISVAHAGNDHRLGSGEAPPAIISIFVGEELVDIIDAIVDGKSYVGSKAPMMDLGIPSIPTFRKDTTDRNRTSPFAFTGNKFEFRMLGSSQNIAMPNVVLNTTVAESFRQFADRLEGVEDKKAEITKIIRETFAAHKRIIFEGNGYSDEWKEEAERRGLLNLATSVDAYKRFSVQKNIELFERHGVMNEIEMRSRQEILLENYSKIVNIEALTMIEMATRDIIPAVNSYIAEIAHTAAIKAQVVENINCSVERDMMTKLSTLNAKTYTALGELRRAETEAAKIISAEDRAEAYVGKVIPAMEKLRSFVDEMETLTASEYWPLPSYGDMMFNI